MLLQHFRVKGAGFWARSLISTIIGPKSMIHMGAKVPVSRQSLLELRTSI